MNTIQIQTPEIFVWLADIEFFFVIVLCYGVEIKLKNPSCIPLKV